MNLGTAFQLIDDLLDYKAIENDFGKMTGDDFKEGKMTLPVILALRRSNKIENNFWKKTIQDGQISDFNTQLSLVSDTSYSKGFEDGKTQAGVALAQGGSLYNYTDGYHAAISQVREDSPLDVSEALLTELNNLRKMVPRLLNQVEKMTEENNHIKSTDGYVLEMLLETLEFEDNADETYLEIIELLTQSDTEETQVLRVD